MTPPQAPDAVLELLTDVLDIPAAELADDVGPGKHTGWTSMKQVQLVVEIEDRFGVSLTHKEIRGLRSVAAVRETLRAKGALEVHS